MSLLMHKVAHATSECNELARVLAAVVRKVGQRPPLGRDPPGQRPLGQRPLWTETPLDRDPLDRDPPGQTNTCQNITFGNFVCGGLINLQVTQNTNYIKYYFHFIFSTYLGHQCHYPKFFNSIFLPN